MRSSHDRRTLIEAACHYGIGVSMAFREPDKLCNTLGYSVARIRVNVRDIKKEVIRWLIIN